MFERRVAHHFHEAGWTVQTRPTLAGPSGTFQPDLLLAKGGRRKAVLIRDHEPPGPFEIAKFGAACKKLGVQGIVVAPDDPANLELYDQANLEFVPGETIGDVVVLGDAPTPAPLREPVPAPVLAAARPAPVAAPLARRSRMGWRWAVVALIWAAALATLAYDVWLYTR